MEEFKEFYTCPRCGSAICGEKEKYFVCPECGRALCNEKELENFEDNYCGNCGKDIASAKEHALAIKKVSREAKEEVKKDVVTKVSCRG